MAETRRLPDFLIIGAPKAGTTALHDALARHPQLHAARVKEPKYFLTENRPPDPRAHRGPGDAHSAREWVWRRDRYERLFAAAPPGTLRFESTPFYLWDRRSHPRIARTVPDAKLIVVLRDPVDRAFSNWTHLWADGLGPEGDFLAACRAEPARAAAGWAPFWRYLELGRYGEQLTALFEHVDPARVRVVRYRRLIDTPRQTLDELCAFLRVDTGVLDRLPESNVGRWAADGRVNRVLRRAIRGGAVAGARAHPKLWRVVQRPLVAGLQRGVEPRPRLDPAVRSELVEQFREDVTRLSQLLGTDYSDWLTPEGRGTYTVRRS
ncbi:MAG TPA: sulfotransferase [Jatrophihabitans sp.]|nr:sulfotransferase [Jatrophihabitans sp.]